jgi:hypothetical protein
VAQAVLNALVPQGVRDFVEVQLVFIGSLEELDGLTFAPVLRCWTHGAGLLFGRRIGAAGVGLGKRGNCMGY